MRSGRAFWLLAAVGAIGLALGASAQTRPGTMTAGPPANSSQSRPRPIRTLQPSAFAAAPAANATTLSPRPTTSTQPRPSTPAAAPTNSLLASLWPFGGTQTRPSTSAAAPPANPRQTNSFWPFGGAQTQPPPSAAAPPADPWRAQPLLVDVVTAGNAANSPVNARGRGAVAGFISANAGAINQVQIPVLLPGEPDLAASLRIFPNGAFYTVSSKSNGMSFVLTGAGRAFPLSPQTARALPGGDLRSRIPPDGIVIDGAEGGMDASFSRFGASYSISLECAQPETDTRCTNPAYVRGVIARLVVVMPGSAQ